MSWLSCRKYSERASRSLDGRLSFRDRVGFWAHAVLCFTCRRFHRQVATMDEALKCIGKGQCADDGSIKDIYEKHNHCLSPDIAEKIKKAMRDGDVTPEH